MPSCLLSAKFVSLAFTFLHLARLSFVFFKYICDTSLKPEMRAHFIDCNSSYYMDNFVFF